jgi:hypothetical protein
MANSFELTIPIVWRHIRDIRRRVGEALRGHGEEVRQAAAMVAAELVENAIKYGESVPDMPDATLRFEETASEVRVEVANGLTSPDAARRLEDLIGRVHRDTDGATLYVARLQELLADPDASGKLGLYRIRYEGGFQLASRYEGQVLTITATRGIP